MLKRQQLRRYLMALLWHDNVIQTADCESGPLWTNCDGERIDVLDHETHQIFEDGDEPYQLRSGNAIIVFSHESVNYELSATELEVSKFRVQIDIVANEASGRKRQDILDTIEERIYYRLLSYQTFTDASTGENLTSFMRWLDRNNIRIETRDDSAFKGNYTLRQMVLSFEAKDCIRRPGCDDVPICFDLEKLTLLDGDCNPST
jgi:hypothetical protein